MTDIVNLTPHFIGTPATGVNLYQVPNASMEVLQDIINATWNLALDKSTAASTKVSTLTGTGGILDPALSPTVSGGSSTVPTISAPGVTIPASASVTDVFTTFSTEYIALATWLEGEFTSLITAKFPNEHTLYASAESWLAAALANPEVGLPAAVASQIWTDDRDRITADASRSQADVFDSFAAKGFPIPPGAAASAAIKIQQKAQDEIAESSRRVAAMSVDMQKFTVESAMKLRDMMLRDTTDYIKALVSSPDVVSRMVNIGYDAQQKLISSAADFYRADAQAKDIIAKANQFNASLTFDAAKANQGAKLAIIEDNVKALLSDIQNIVQQATAALNNLHVGVTMQAGGTTVTTQAQNI